MKRWKVLQGIHSEGGKTYHQGDIVETNKNLAVFGSDKFAEVVAAVEDSVEALEAEKARIDARLKQLQGASTVDPATEPDPSDPVEGETEDGLENMTVEELKHHAGVEEIPLGKAKSKAEIIAAIRFATE